MNYRNDGQPVVDEMIPKSYLDLENVIMKTVSSVRSRQSKTQSDRGFRRKLSLCFGRKSETDSNIGNDIIDELEVPIMQRKQIAELCLVKERV